MSRYIALLRGINVGGKNIIRMADLRTCFEDAGFADVTTYIQSGNVVFSAPGRSARTLTKHLERMLQGAFDYHGSVVVRSGAEMGRVVERAPASFGKEPGTYRYDVMFLKDAVTPAAVLKVLRALPLRDGVDRAWAGPKVVYFARLDARAAQSRLSKVTSLPIYQHMTVRNWNTTQALYGYV